MHLRFPSGGSGASCLTGMYLGQVTEMFKIAATENNLEAVCFYMIARHCAFHHFIIKAWRAHGTSHLYLIRRYER